jgi:hypothetical protein
VEDTKEEFEIKAKAEFVIRLDALFDEYLAGKTCLDVYNLIRQTDYRITSIAPMFYNVVLRSTLIASVLSADNLYNKNDRRCVNLRAFLNESEKLANLFQNATCEQVLEEIKSSRMHIATLNDSIEKLAIRRNNGIGHLTEAIIFSKDETEKRMEMSIAEFTGLFDYAAQLLNTFNQMWNGQITSRRIPHADDYKRLLKLLTEQRNTEIEKHNKAFPFDVMKKIEPKSCSEKDRHASEADAYAAASRRVGNRHDKPAALRAYLCPECKGWHLTKQVEENKS